jgi:cytoskeletal protein CcmA (bactofilin family)
MADPNNTRSTNDKKTLIEEGTELKGTLSSLCPIVVMGKIEGEVTGPAVEVTDTGCLSGKIRVTELRSQGELAGEVDADVVHLAGRIRDKTIVRAKELEVKLGPTSDKTEVVFGACELCVGDVPNKETALADAKIGKKRSSPPEEKTES